MATAPQFSAQLADNAKAHQQIGEAINQLKNAVEQLNNGKQGQNIDGQLIPLIELAIDAFK